MKGYLEKYFLGEFGKNTLILLTGTVIAQMIPFAMQLVLRRVFSPEEFGAFSVYMSLLGILAILATLRFELAILLPKENNDAANLLGLTIFLSLIANIIFSVIILVFHRQILHILSFPEKFGVFLYFIPLGVFLVSTYQAINYWLIRIKAFKSSSINKVSRRLSEGVVQIIFGIFHLPIGLVIADIFGNLINNLSGLIQIFKNGFNPRSINQINISVVCRKYVHFPKFNLLPAVLDTCTLAMPIFIINKFFSAEFAGYVDLTQLAIVAPLSLISSTISQVLFQKITEKRNTNRKIIQNVFHLSLILFSISLIVLLIIQFWSENLFAFFFGEKWTFSGQIAKILVLSYTVRFIVSPLSIIFIALERISIQAFWQIGYFLLIGSLIFFADKDFKDFLRLFVLFELLAYLIYYFLIIKISRDHDNSIALA